MERELRKVPANWEHPIASQGELIAVIWHYTNDGHGERIMMHLYSNGHIVAYKTHEHHNPKPEDRIPVPDDWKSIEWHGGNKKSENGSWIGPFKFNDVPWK